MRERFGGGDADRIIALKEGSGTIVTSRLRQ
jgi:hypothetical protein